MACHRDLARFLLTTFVEMTVQGGVIPSTARNLSAGWTRPRFLLPPVVEMTQGKMSFQTKQEENQTVELTTCYGSPVPCRRSVFTKARPNESSITRS